MKMIKNLLIAAILMIAGFLMIKFFGKELSMILYQLAGRFQV